MQEAGENCLDYLRKIAEEDPHRRLLGDERGWLCAGEVLEKVIRMAGAVLSRSLRPADIVMLSAPRCRDTAVMILALRAAGLTVLLADPREKISQVSAECESEIPVSAVISRISREGFCMIKNGCRTLLSTEADTGNAAKADTGNAAEVDIADAADMELPPVSPMDPAFIIFTSGSTGKKKAVVLCENNLISDLVFSRPLGDYRTDDIALGVLPLTHVFGLVLLVGTLVLDYSLYFPEGTDTQSILSCVEKEKITRMNGVPSLYLAMAEEAERYDLSSLRTGFIGGGPVTADLFIRMEKKLGMTLIPAYGMTESIGISCASYLDSQAERAAGTGRIYPVNTVRILTEEGNEAGIGQTGEIWVKGPMRMLGYFGSPYPREDLFPTGDLGYLDEKKILHLTGRKKELIIRNGNNLSPVRIEQALLRIPGVYAAAVIGLPDDRQGEVPYAMIVGAADLFLLRKLLHKNELPAGILSVDSLPFTASGKPDKRKIAEALRLWKNG